MIERIREPGFDINSLPTKDKIKLVRESDGALSDLLKGAIVESNLDLHECSSLVMLPKRLEIWGYLDLVECVHLTNLPIGLKIGGSLFLDGCTALTSLPEGLKLTGNLHLGNCPAKIPDSAIIKGKIFRD